MWKMLHVAADPALPADHDTLVHDRKTVFVLAVLRFRTDGFFSEGSGDVLFDASLRFTGRYKRDQKAGVLKLGEDDVNKRHEKSHQT